jgi:hypothetical protein
MGYGREAEIHCSGSTQIELCAKCAKVPKTKRKSPPTSPAEGLFSEKSRGDWTPLELFLAASRAWQPRIKRLTEELCGWPFDARSAADVLGFKRP